MFEKTDSYLIFLILQWCFSEFLFEKDDKMRAIREAGAHTRVCNRMSIRKQNRRIRKSYRFEVFSRGSAEILSKPACQSGRA